MMSERRKTGRATVTENLNRAFSEIRAMRNVAGPDEDPNISPIGYASPPCYMHELGADVKNDET